jgi:hypothetical protein
LPDEQSGQRAWLAGGSVNAHILATEADQVLIPQLGATLCVLLAGQQWKGPNNDCASSSLWASGERPGDWCSSTNAPASASCLDAFRFKAEFAAAAFAIIGDC